MPRSIFQQLESTLLLLLVVLFGALGMSAPGCVSGEATDAVESKVWGKRGLSDGQFLTPRAIVSNQQGLNFIVDKTGRIQVFDNAGQFIRSWRTPEIKMANPVGLGWTQTATCSSRIHTITAF